MTLTASDVAPLKSALGWWEFAEYLSTGVVLLGCVGEFFAEFTRFPRSEHSKHKLARLSLILVIAGIAGELCATLRSSELSGQIIAYVEQNASDAKTSADRAATAASQAEGSAGQASADAGNAKTLAAGARKEADSYAAEIASAEKEAAAAESDLADARQRAVAAERAFLELQKQVLPRHVTPEQKTAFIKALGDPKGIPAIKMWYDPGTSDGLGFGRDLRDMFKSAGISVDFDESPMTMVPRTLQNPDVAIDGLAFAGTTPEIMASTRVATALIAAGIATVSIPASTYEGKPWGHVTLRITNRIVQPVSIQPAKR